MEDNVLSINTVAVSAAENRGKQPDAKRTSASAERLLTAVTSQLSDDKAEDVITIDLEGKSSIGDYMIVCSGRSTRQVSALAEKLIQKIKVDFGIISRVEGKDRGDWVLIDTGDIIIHIFRPEVREFYQLEKMWLAASPPAT
ncbi:MAG: ribosome silencing factor [Aestuariivita sp.]|nr:ribosome silencing factor [Aestuariivita sp.]